MAKKTIDNIITGRFLEVMSDFVGPGRKYRFEKDFCEAMKMHTQELTKVKNGVTYIQYRWLIRLHELTLVNMDWMILGKGDKYKTGVKSELDTIKEMIVKMQETIKK